MFLRRLSLCLCACLLGSLGALTCLTIRHASAHPLLTPAATLEVDSLADTTANDGFCTLREAIINANDNATTWVDCTAGSGADTIDLSGLSGQIVLLSDLPPLTDAAGLTVLGPGAAQLTVSGGGVRRIFDAQGGAPFTLRNLTLANAGTDGAAGSAIRALDGSTVSVQSSTFLTNANSAINIEGGRLSVIDSIFRGNIAERGARAGGAIRAINNFRAAQPAPTLFVEDSTFTGNQAGGGHAIHQASGSLTLNRSTFAQNGAESAGYGTVEYRDDIVVAITECDFLENQAVSGAALHDPWGAGPVTVERSRFIGNIGDETGAIRHGGGRTLTVSQSVFGENAAQGTNAKGGVINSYAAITITTTSFYSNTASDSGGVIFTHNDATGPTTIAQSVFYGNQAVRGGAIWFGRGLVITNSTFYSNRAQNGGALASFEGFGEVTNSTFANNAADQGASLYFLNTFGAAPALRNSILANPQRSTNCYATVGNSYADLGGNLQWPDNSCNSTIAVVDPLLALDGLQDNGGPTKSIALQANSPAIDRTPAGGGFVCPAVDQRGAIRPVDGNGDSIAGCDSGAYEYGGIGAVTLAKTASDVNGAPLLPGDTLRYVLRLENTFDAAVAGVVVTDSVPTHTTYVADSANPPASTGPNPLMWNSLTVAAKSALTLTFEVTIDPNAGGQVITNSACIAQPGSAQPCTEPVTPPGPDGGVVRPKLAVAKAALDLNGAPLLPGDTIRYTIRVTNAHAVTVTGVSVSDAIPTNTTYVAGSAAPAADAETVPLVWSGITVPAGESRTFQLDVTVNPLTGGQTIANVACVAQPGLASFCTQPVTPPGPDGGVVRPQVSLAKSALDLNGRWLEEGDVIRYTIVVSNPHGVVAAGVIISDSIPEHTTYVTGSATPAAAEADPLVWSSVSVPAGESRTFQFDVTVNADTLGLTIRNVACMTQPEIAWTCTPPVEPSGGGQVMTSLYAPLIANAEATQ
jgi:uncharacterized repeat protein (TIGR01451 family)/CSLREA domain-containing protein